MGWFVIVNLFNNIALRNQKFTKSSESDPMFEVSGSRAKKGSFCFDVNNT